MRAIRVQFKPVGKHYFFGVDNKHEVTNGTKVVVNTIRGIELGSCVGDIFDLKAEELTSELKNILRDATKEDIKNYEENKRLEEDIIKTTKKISIEYNLEMKILEAEYTLDKSKLIIYFESEGRVDFRDLVKELADKYHTRIELRQVGSRDSAKVFGGIGPCGLVVCCKTFITQFNNVSVKMAKNQSLSLNPIKISGNCSKLLCCINYENDLYVELRKHAPDIGDLVETENGMAKVLTCDVINKTLKVKYKDTDSFGYLKLDDVKFTPSKDKNKKYEDEDYSDVLDLE